MTSSSISSSSSWEMYRACLVELFRSLARSMAPSVKVTGREASSRGVMRRMTRMSPACRGEAKVT
jgi:hypothetical protein